MRILYLRLVPVFLGVFVLYWFIPQSYLRATRSEYQQTKAMYSPIKKEFVVWDQNAVGFTMKTEANKELNQKQGRMLLPFLFARDVAKWQGFPLVIDGKTYTYEDAKNLQVLKMLPRKALIGLPHLYIILESQPDTSSFDLPEDIMILKKNAVHFVNAETGKLDKQKSELFTTAIQNAGAKFPWKAAANNPDPFKAFDEGLFFVDATNTLFQMQMVKGQPMIKNMHYVLEKPVISLTVQEDISKDYYGLIVTNDTLYINRYNAEPLALPFSYNVQEQSVDILGTAVSYSINIKKLDGTKLFKTQSIATDKNFNVLRQYENVISEEQKKEHEWIKRGLAFLTPFSLVQFTPKATGIVFEWRVTENILFSGLGAVTGMILYLLVQYIWQKQRQSFVKRNILPLVIIAIFGLPAAIILFVFAPICIVKNTDTACKSLQ